MMMRVQSTLERFDFYRKAPVAFQNEAAAAAKPVQLPSAGVFYREGDAAEQFALVGTGDVRVLKISETGREITLYHVRDGQICLVNMLCVLLGRPAMATAIAEETTEAVIVPAATFRTWVNREEAVRRFIFETMALRMLDVMTLVEEVAFRRMDDRVAALLLERFASSGAATLATSHEEIAAELGTAREVVSRVLKNFERLGAIGLGRREIELRDAAALRMPHADPRA